MQAYVAAHDDIVGWLDSLREEPAPAEVAERLWTLAVTAAARGMTSTHWVFVVDGLVAYVNRKRPGDILLSSNIARGFDLASRWTEVQAETWRTEESRIRSASGS